MSKIIKRKYKQSRKEFKRDLYKIMQGNVTLALLVQQVCISKIEHKLLYEVFEITGFRHREAYKEICDHNIPTRMFEGKSHSIFNKLYFVNQDIYYKYIGKIPETYVFGDAYSVAKRVFRECKK